MKTKTTNLLPLAALLAFASVASAAEPSVQDQIDALKNRLQELDAKVRPLQRAETSAGDKGFSLTSPDGGTSLRIRGLVQVDSRWFGDDTPASNDSILLRRARIGLEGKFGKTIEYQVTGEFGNKTSAEVLDANITFAYAPELQLKVGRFKTPVGLEQLQSDSAALFIERSLVSQIAPNRDLGVQVGGEINKGVVSYAIGVFDGLKDGGNNDNNQSDLNDGKDVAARVIFQPWVNDEDSVLAGLSFGIGGSYGLHDVSSAANKYKTDGQQEFFAASTAVANGHVARLSPQLSFYAGGLSVLAEYITSRLQTANGDRTNKAWQVATGYVLTGEKASYKGVTPSADFDRAAGTWGAFELVARYAVLDADDKYFSYSPTASVNRAAANASATRASSYAAGINWYVSKLARLSLDFTHTSFDLAPASTTPTNLVLLQSENAILTRFQLNF